MGHRAHASPFAPWVQSSTRPEEPAVEYDDEALSEIALLGDVLAAAACARSRIPTLDLDRVLEASAAVSVARRGSRAGRPGAITLA